MRLRRLRPVTLHSLNNVLFTGCAAQSREHIWEEGKIVLVILTPDSIIVVGWHSLQNKEVHLTHQAVTKR